MDKIRFYTDEHIAKAVVRGLQQRGIEVFTCQGADMLGKTDKDHLHFAYKQACVIVTQDTDFLILHHEGVPHSGIAYAPQGTSVSHLIQGLLLISQVLTPAEMINTIEFL